MKHLSIVLGRNLFNQTKMKPTTKQINDELDKSTFETEEKLLTEDESRSYVADKINKKACEEIRKFFEEDEERQIADYQVKIDNFDWEIYIIFMKEGDDNITIKFKI